MKKLGILFLALFACNVASAQTIPSVINVAGWYSAMGSKVDVTNGKLTTPAVTGGTITTTDLSNAMALASGASTSRTPASHFADVYNVLDFGAKCDSSTDDTTAFNAALTAAGSATSVGGGHVLVRIPGKECKVSGVVNVPMGVSLQGAGFMSTMLDFSATSSIVYQVVSNQSASTVSDFGIQYVGGDPGTSSKYAIDMSTNIPSMAIARNIYVINAHYAFDLSGNNDVLDSLHILGNHGVGIRVGYMTTTASTVDPRITNTTIVGDYQPGGTTSSAVGMLIYDAGGLYLVNNDILYGKYGTEIIPGANQQITWLFADNTVFGDTTQNDMLHIDTTASTAQILGLNIANSWTSNGSGSANWIGNDGGGTVTGIYFNGERIFSGVNDEMHIGTGVNNVKVIGSNLCGDGVGTAIYISANDNNITIQDNDFSKTCTSNSSSNTETGISLGGSNNNVIITGNNIPVSKTPISTGTQTSTANIVIENNIPAKTQSQTITAATTIDLPNGQDTYAISGTTSIQNMTSGWAGRRVTLYNSSNSMTFATGGTSGQTMCNSLTVSTYVPVIAEYHGCWLLK